MGIPTAQRMQPLPMTGSFLVVQVSQQIKSRGVPGGWFSSESAIVVGDLVRTLLRLSAPYSQPRQRKNAYGSTADNSISPSAHG